MTKQNPSSPIKRHKDHFVPRVYLRRFVDNQTNKLHIYDRQKNLWFEAPPKRVCFEFGWDKLNSDGTDTYLYDNLKVLEPALTAFLTAFETNAISNKDRYYFSTWLAILFSLSPKKTNYDTAFLQKLVKDANLQINVDKYETKQMNMEKVKEIALTLYTYDWRIIYNYTDMPFITCDFPAHHYCLNDNFDPEHQPFGIALDPTHFLKITPKIPLLIDRSKDYTEHKPGTLTRGYIKHGRYFRKTVSRINEHAIFNAERFIISSYIGKGLIQFVKNRKNKTTKLYATVLKTPNGTTIKTRLKNNFENVPVIITKKIAKKLAKTL